MIACALSGGVDSAVSLHLLLKRFPRRLVKAVFMRNWNEGGDNQCPLSEDLKTAEKVAHHFDVELTTVDFSREYWLNVFEPMLQDYVEGVTPNPDVLCNMHIKFDRLLKFCQENLGVEKLATGHYARVSRTTNRAARLLRGIDHRKDQTFFLAGIKRKALQFAEFPVGEIPKTEVKRIAVQMGMPELAAKKESMGICFIGKRNFKEFIDQYIESRPGNFVDIDTGKIVAQHKGKHMWTLGQRLFLQGERSKYYVAKIFPHSNDISVCAGNAHPSLFCDTLTTFRPHWLNSDFEEYTGNLLFKTQQAETPSSCRLTSNSTRDGLEIRIGHFKRAVSPGQFIVLYHGDECVGCAKIKKPGPTLQELRK